jgi:hypothetical protein
MDPNVYMPEWWLELGLVKDLSRQWGSIVLGLHACSVVTVVAATVKTTELARSCTEYQVSLAMRTGKPPTSKPVNELLLWVFVIGLLAVKFLWFMFFLPLSQDATERATFAFASGVIALAYVGWTYWQDRLNRQRLPGQ